MMRVTEQKAQEPKKRNFMEKIFAELLGMAGIKHEAKNKKESEIVALRKQVRVVKKENDKEEKQETSKDAIPLVYEKEEIGLEKERPQTEPMVEGTEKKEKKKGKKDRNDVTFTNFEGESKEEKKKRKETIAKKKKEERFGGFKRD